MLRIHNSLTGRKEPFAPLEPGHVRMYVCGMTVYDHIHVGHARSQVAFDVARRWLRASGYRVTYVRNITDIDDKILDRARERGEPYEALTARFIASMNADFDALGMEKPDHEPRATGYIPEIVAMIERLVARGFAYAVPNGDVYYAVARFPDYGKLSGKKLADLRAGARVEVDEAKRDPLDFVLWKRAKPGEPAWDSPWGSGRPGWHIECSAMAVATPGPAVRHPRRRHGPEVPAPRERDCPELRRLRRALRESLDAQRVRARGRREDVEVARQFLHGTRSPAEAAPGGPASIPAVLALPGAGQLHGRQPAPGGCRASATLSRAT